MIFVCKQHAALPRPPSSSSSPAIGDPIMEAGSHEMHGKGEMLPPEKGKRKLKTPAQIEALEKFYSEHKYPSELMKLQFAKQIRLSEKQVSGWFCHRRLKDKKLVQGDAHVNGKHSFSNGAIHDHTSGHRQESCSSTKQGDRPFDSKEVESERFYSYSSSAAVLASERTGPHIQAGHYTVGDDRSSGSCSAPQDQMLQQYEDPCAVKLSRYSFQDDDYLIMNSKGVKNRRHVVESRYPYLQSEIENPSVTSVKMKLGMHYHEDGPQLGVVFDPLPPGAFDSPIKDSIYDPYYVGDAIQQRCCSIPRITKDPKGYDKNRCEMRSNGFYPEVRFERTIQGLHHKKESTSSQLTPEYSLKKHHDHAFNRTFVMRNDEDSAGKTFGCKSRKIGKSLKNSVLGDSDNGISHQIHSNGKKATTNKSLSYPRLKRNCSNPAFQRDGHEAKFFNLGLHNNGFIDTEDTMKPMRPIKKGKIHRTLENHNSICQDMRMASGTKIGRQANGIKFHPHEQMVKCSEKFRRTKPVIRSSRDVVATSFSEDETEGSTSSVD